MGGSTRVYPTEELASPLPGSSSAEPELLPLEQSSTSHRPAPHLDQSEELGSPLPGSRAMPEALPLGESSTTHRPAPQPLYVSREEISRQSVHLPVGSAVLHGRFLVDNAKERDFVFVEAGCQLSDANQMEAILTALGIEEPSLSFCFRPSHAVAPSLDVQDEANQALVQWIVERRELHTKSKHSERFEEMLEGANEDVMEAAERLNRPPTAHHEKRLIEEQLRNCITGIAEAGRQLKTIFLLPAPYKGNRLSEIACECLQPGSVALGLFAASDFTILQKQGPREEEVFEAFTLPSMLYTMHLGQWTPEAWVECKRQFKLPLLAFRAQAAFERAGGSWADLQQQMRLRLLSQMEIMREKAAQRRKPHRSQKKPSIGKYVPGEGTSQPGLMSLAEVRDDENTVGRSHKVPSEAEESQNQSDDARSQLDEEDIRVDAELTLEKALATVTLPEFDVGRAKRAVKACLAHEQLKLSIHAHIEELRSELADLVMIRDDEKSFKQVAENRAKRAHRNVTAQEVSEAEARENADDKHERLEHEIEELENKLDELEQKLEDESHRTSGMPLASRALEKVMSIDAQATLNEELDVSDHPAALTQEAAMRSLASCDPDTALGLDPRRVPAFLYAEPAGQPFEGEKRKKYLHSLRSEVDHTISCSSSITTFEAEYARHVRKLELPGGLISSCTHALVFEDKAMIDQFVHQFSLEYPTGLVVAGGEHNVFEDAVRCIQEGKPLFIFKGTGEAADVLADVVDFYEEHMETIMHPDRDVGADKSTQKKPRKGEKGKRSEVHTMTTSSTASITPAPFYEAPGDAALTTALLARGATRTAEALESHIGIAAEPSDDAPFVGNDASALTIMRTVNVDSKKVDAVSLWDHFEELKHRGVRGKKLEEARSKLQSAQLMSEMKRHFSAVEQAERIEREYRLALKRASGDRVAVNQATDAYKRERKALLDFAQHVHTLAKLIAKVEDHDTPFALEQLRLGANKVKLNTKALKTFLVDTVQLYSSHASHGAHGSGGANDKRLAIVQHFVDRVGILPQLKERAVMLLQNFPETFNKQAVLTVNLGIGSLVKVETLQDSITKVMSTVFDEAPELGGKMAEERAILHVLMLKLQLEKTARNYWWEATVLQVIYRMLSLSALSLVTVSGIVEGNGMATLVHYFYYPSIVLPITVALFASLFAMYKPMDRFAVAFLCAKTIESELMRYRTRTGRYRTTTSNSGKKSHRKKFSDTCEELFLNCMMSEMRAGVLARTRTAALRLANGFSSQSVDETLERERDVAARERAQAVGKLKTAMRAKKREKRMLQIAGITMGVCSADEYINTRVVRELASIAKKSPPRYWTHWILVILALVSSAAGGILSSARLSEWVPMTLAITTMLEYLDKYFMLEQNLASGNMAQASLQATLLWWDGLSLVERRSREGKDRLVDMCENAIVARHAAFAAGALAATRSGDNDNSAEGGVSLDTTTNASSATGSKPRESTAPAGSA